MGDTHGNLDEICDFIVRVWNYFMARKGRFTLLNTVVSKYTVAVNVGVFCQCASLGNTK